jgi:hypothetical protein
MKLTGLICAIALAAGTPAFAGQDPVVAPDEPMRELFKSPAVVAYITTPGPGAEGRVRVWTWMFLKQPIPAGADALAMEWDVDCAGRTVRTVNTALYNGETHMRTEAGQTPAAAPAAGTPGALTLGAACATGRSRVAPLPDRAAARARAVAMFAAQP